MNQFKTIALLAALTALFMSVGYVIGGSGGAMMALLFAAGMNLFTFWNADKIVLKMHGAVEVSAASAPQYYGLVQQLAARAGMPMPKVYIIEQDAPNAFATGRNPENAAVAATSGLLNLLTTEEVAGVMAHELGHVRNRDTLIMTMVATIAGAISMIANFGMFFGDRNRGMASLAAVFMAPFAAMIVQMAISRTREYGADKAGAEISGNPQALASALEKISGAAAHIPNPVSERVPAAAQLYIVPTALSQMFSTHPATEKRVAALRAMTRSGSFDSSGGANEGRNRKRNMLDLNPPPRGRGRSALDPIDRK